MSRETGIEWTDATWNPIRGCSRVSEGCRNCYAEVTANRFCKPGGAYDGVVQIGANGKGTGKWNGQIKFVEKHLLDPLKWKPVFLKCEVCGVQQYQCLCEKFNHRPRRIFVNSMSDLFHENVTDEMLDRIFAVMALCPQHTFQVLTKRPARMQKYLTTKDRWMGIYHWADDDWLKLHPGGDVKAIATLPLPNVQLGVSVENQKAADERIPLLLQTPAAVRFLSCEPLLGPVDVSKLHLPQLNSFATTECDLDGFSFMVDGKPALNWVIVGGESGPGARPMHPDWARSLRGQCVAAEVPFFFKQWGEWADVSAAPYEGARAQQEHNLKASGEVLGVGACGNGMVDPGWRPAGASWMRRVGKKAAGALLDGREWREMPG